MLKKMKTLRHTKSILDRSLKLFMFVCTCLLASSFIVLLPVDSLAEENRVESCFPVGRARHDRECYDFDEKNKCLKTDDIFSCAWGQRRENPIRDDEMLLCDTARCEELPDEHDF